MPLFTIVSMIEQLQIKRKLSLEKKNHLKTTDHATWEKIQALVKCFSLFCFARITRKDTGVNLIIKFRIFHIYRKESVNQMVFIQIYKFNKIIELSPCQILPIRNFWKWNVISSQFNSNQTLTCLAVHHSQCFGSKEIFSESSKNTMDEQTQTHKTDKNHLLHRHKNDVTATKQKYK